jgi:hypothetical protein
LENKTTRNILLATIISAVGTLLFLIFKDPGKFGEFWKDLGERISQKFKKKG